MEDLLKQLMSQMDKRFEQMDKGFGPNGTRQELNSEVQGIKGEVQELKSEVQGIKGEVQELKAEVQGIKVEMANNQTENRSHFKHIESKLEQQQSTFQVVAEEIRGVRIDIEFLSGKTGKHDAEINNLKQRIHS